MRRRVICNGTCSVNAAKYFRVLHRINLCELSGSRRGWISQPAIQPGSSVCRKGQQSSDLVAERSKTLAGPDSSAQVSAGVLVHDQVLGGSVRQAREIVLSTQGGRLHR